jgi:hypothetical protein
MFNSHLGWTSLHMELLHILFQACDDTRQKQRRCNDNRLVGKAYFASAFASDCTLFMATLDIRLVKFSSVDTRSYDTRFSCP